MKIETTEKEEGVDYLPEATEYQQRLEEYLTLTQAPTTTKHDKNSIYIQPIIQ